MSRAVLTTCALAALLASRAVPASNPEAEIRFLLGAIERSACAFVRNGKAYEASAAAAHLSMKYDRGKRWVRDAEQFITRIASKSRLSGEPYYAANEIDRNLDSETCRVVLDENGQLRWIRGDGERQDILTVEPETTRRKRFSVTLMGP